jgi:hypothetical protein
VCLRTSLDAVTIEQPVFVAGLARSGSTILLEVLADHPRVATHRYRDFPAIFTPFWWNEIVRHAPRRQTHAVERSHRDGIMITPDSPEAMEEPIWQRFFPETHQPDASHVLDGSQARPDFEAFYRHHIRKMLMVRGGDRWVSKGNYNLPRLKYLLKLFPDARFIVPVRRPAAHIASLLKQQQLFAEGARQHPRSLDHLRRVGHYEFGLDRRPINVGDAAAANEVLRLWEQGEEVRGWARYWAQLHTWIANCLDDDPRIGDAVHVVRFEDLCADPVSALTDLLLHCDLLDQNLVLEYAERIHAPTYYKPQLSPEEERIIAEETGDVAQRFGYDDVVVPSEPACVAGC